MNPNLEIVIPTKVGTRIKDECVRTSLCLTCPENETFKKLDGISANSIDTIDPVLEDGEVEEKKVLAIDEVEKENEIDKEETSKSEIGVQNVDIDDEKITPNRVNDKDEVAEQIPDYAKPAHDIIMEVSDNIEDYRKGYFGIQFLNGSEQEASVVVENVPKAADIGLIQEYFSCFGDVRDVILARNRQDMNCHVIATVSFKELQRHVVSQREVVVKPLSPKIDPVVFKSCRELLKEKTTLYISGLSDEICSDTLRSELSCFGVITDISIVRDSFTHKCLGNGFITYKTSDMACNALAAGRKSILGREACLHVADTSDINLHCENTPPLNDRNPSVYQPLLYTPSIVNQVQSQTVASYGMSYPVSMNPIHIPGPTNYTTNLMPQSNMMVFQPPPPPKSNYVMPFHMTGAGPMMMNHPPPTIYQHNQENLPYEQTYQSHERFSSRERGGRHRNPNRHKDERGRGRTSRGRFRGGGRSRYNNNSELNRNHPYARNQ